jgi:hypothetical protein
LSAFLASTSPITLSCLSCIANGRSDKLVDMAVDDDDSSWAVLFWVCVEMRQLTEEITTYAPRTSLVNKVIGLARTNLTRTIGLTGAFIR